MAQDTSTYYGDYFSDVFSDTSSIPSPTQTYASFSDNSQISSPTQNTSIYFSDNSPIPSPTQNDAFSYMFQQPLVEQCSSYEDNTGIQSPTYAALEPVDSQRPVYDVRVEVPYKTERTTLREQHVQVFQLSSNEFCARLGSFNYNFDVNETFDNTLDFPRDIPVPAIERTYSPACTSSNLKRQTTGTGRNRKLPRAERLWEFILRLLLDSNYNPSYIEWVDRERGMFRLVNSRQIARMWGKRKNNFDMTYEKLSRAMRYYYHRKILQPVFGKKLVYKFGPNSTGWQLN